MTRTTHAKLVFVLAIGLLLALGPEQASAQPSFGVRGGVTIEPDAFFVGGHAVFPVPKVPAARLEPAVEVGIGEEAVDFFFLRFLGHGKYMFNIPNSPVAAFPLLGVQVVYINFDTDGVGDSDSTEIGLDLGGGIEVGGFAVQLYFGFGGREVSDLNVTAMYTF